MKTWDKLDNEGDFDKGKEQTNLDLIALTSSETEYEEANEVFSKLSLSDLITFIQDLMGHCQDKVRHMKILKKQYDLLKDKLKSSQNKNEALERDCIALIKENSNKPLHKREMSLQEFIITGFTKTKLASLIYGLSMSKGEGIGYS